MQEETKIEKELALLQYQYEDFLKQYKAFSELLGTIPFPPTIIAIIRQEFDTGYLWAKEGFFIVSQMMKQQAQAPEPVPPSEPNAVVLDDCPAAA